MKAEREEMHDKAGDKDKIAKINALSAEVFEDTKDVKKIQASLNQAKGGDSDDEADDSPSDKKAAKKKAIALEKKQDKENKKKAIELEKQEEA